MTKYTIKEIVKAWESFNQPTYLISGNEFEPQRMIKGGEFLVEDPQSIHKIDVDYSKWINYLISEEWKENKQI